MIVLNELCATGRGQQELSAEQLRVLLACEGARHHDARASRQPDAKHGFCWRRVRVPKGWPTGASEAGTSACLADKLPSGCGRMLASMTAAARRAMSTTVIQRIDSLSAAAAIVPVGVKRDRQPLSSGIVLGVCVRPGKIIWSNAHVLTTRHSAGRIIAMVAAWSATTSGHALRSVRNPGQMTTTPSVRPLTGRCGSSDNNSRRRSRLTSTFARAQTGCFDNPHPVKEGTFSLDACAECTP